MTKAFDRYGSAESSQVTYRYYSTPEYSESQYITGSTYFFKSVEIESEAPRFTHRNYWRKEDGLQWYDNINIRVTPNPNNDLAKKNATNLRFSSFEEFEKFVFILNDRLADYYKARQEYQKSL